MELYKYLYPQGSQPGIMYRLSKIHQPLVNSFPIMSAINTGMYNWAIYFILLLKPFTSNDYKIEEFSDFTNDVSQQNSKLFTVSLDVDSLFTNMPIDEASEYVLRSYSRGKNGIRP